MSNGVDIVLIKRYENLSDKLLHNIFSDEELIYIKEKGNNPETIAGMTAAKEATLKSIGVQFNVYSLKDIIITHENGKPNIVINEEIKKELKYKNFSLSISHDGEYAIAFVINY